MKDGRIRYIFGGFMQYRIDENTDIWSQYLVNDENDIRVELWYEGSLLVHTDKVI